MRAGAVAPTTCSGVSLRGGPATSVRATVGKRPRSAVLATAWATVAVAQPTLAVAAGCFAAVRIAQGLA